MKLRLVLYDKNLLLYCSNGSILTADEDVLNRLLTEFDSPGKFKGNDGYWNTSISDMDKAKGITMAIVDDSLNLIVYNKTAFSALKMLSEKVCKIDCKNSLKQPKMQNTCLKLQNTANCSANIYVPINSLYLSKQSM